MTITDHALGFQGDQSARQNDAETQDDVDALAGCIAGLEIVLERVVAQLNGRVSQQDIDSAKAAAKTALGW